MGELVSTRACFLTAATGLFFPERGLGSASPHRFEIFLVMLYFLRSKVLSCVATREATQEASLGY